MKIGLRTALSQRNGYGKDGIGLARALMARGHDVRIAPTDVDVPIPREVANLLAKPYDVPMDLSIWHIGPERTEIFKPHDVTIARRNIHWTMTGWRAVEHLNWAESWSKAMESFDDVVVYDPASFDAVESLVPAEKLHRVMGGYEADMWKPRPRPRTEMPYRFGMLGVLGARKGPMAALIAWMLLKQEHGDDFNAELHLWSNVPIITVGTRLPEGVYPNHGYWLPEQVQQYYYGLDTLLCPSLAEGKTLPAVEAIASATNVILSDIPAHRAWCDSSMATFVPATQLAEPVEGYVGDQVSPADLAAAMWDAYQNRSKYAERALQASRQIPAMMDWSKCVERLSLTLKLGL